jgi:heat shock protein HslJ
MKLQVATVLLFSMCLMAVTHIFAGPAAKFEDSLPGVFEGTLPCGDCEGIVYRLTLDPEGTFSLETKYLGKADRNQFHVSGPWKLSSDGKVITLENRDQPELFSIKSVDVLRKLDREGNEIQSNLNYDLKRSTAKKNSMAELEHTDWKLAAIGIAAIAADQGNREIYIHLDSGKIHGFAGCNQVSGRYEVKEDSLKFGPLMSTKMFCPQMKTETAFLKALESTAKWKLKEQELELLGTGGELLARFRR